MTITRIVSRKLRFAWLEYQDKSDGVMFHRAMSGYGWRNLFDDLEFTSSPAGRIDREHPDLEIHYSAGTRPDEKGLLAVPKEGHSKFLGDWLLNPGVDDQSRLTFSKTNFIDQADLVAVSGHGVSGKISGDASGKTVDFLLTKLIKEHQNVDVTGRLKYLLIPACNNLEFGTTAQQWLPAFRKAQPIHGVLGYVGKYNGGSDGELVMMRFATFLHEKKPRRTILEAWREANAGRPWGALLLASAVQDTVFKWAADGGLVTPPSSDPVLHFDGKHFPKGRPLSEESPEYEGFFVMGDGKIIDAGNHEDPAVGLFSGQRGHLLLRKNGYATFGKGETMTVLFAKYRLTRREMDLKALLKFDGDWSWVDPRRDRMLTLLEDGNPFKEKENGEPGPTTKVDALNYILPPGEKQVKLAYTVNGDAKVKYPDDPGVGNPMFIVFLFPPGADRSDQAQGISMSGHGAYLRG